MAELMEGVQPPAVEQAEEKLDDKLPLKIRIALFFDGTLNNRFNIDEREGATEIYKANAPKKGPNSYDNGRTNVAIMEQNIRDTASGYDVALKHYIEGQGTFNLEKDSGSGYALGAGDSGVAGRAEKGVKSVVTLIQNDKRIKVDQYYIEKLTIDVFGFSRGSATARYAIHLLLKDKKKPIYKCLQTAGYTITEDAVKVCFAGLYDTVLSYYGSQYLKSTSNVLQQKAVQFVDKKVIHLTAAEEHRKDFPLHNIRSAGAKGFEFFLPGVHSDVGGSYNTASDKELEVQTDESKKIYMKPTDEIEMDINEGDLQKLEKDRLYLKTQGWYTDSEMTITPLVTDENDQPTYAALTVNRKGIRSAYSNIPLKIMAEFAKDPEININFNEKLEDKANIILKAEPDLQILESKILSYVGAKKGSKDSKPADWLNDASLFDIRHKHLHFSAKVGVGYSPRFSKGVRTRYEYDA
ncbi:MAG: DUF2235 domain-containing protein [Pseudomonadota bacterium]